MAGAPSQLDLFDPKPALTKYDGQDIPAEFIEGERFAFIKGTPKLLASPFAFRRHGQSGAEISELLPHLAKVADDLAIVRSMRTTQFNHAPAQIFMNTGHQVIGRPSLGSWLSYGLGSENRDLPAFVVLLSGENNPDGGKSCWGSGFLPTEHQGVEFRSGSDPVLFVSNPPGVDADVRRRSIDAINDLNRLHATDVGDPEIQTRIDAYELAYRMQTSVPELTDLRGEPASIHELYGTEPIASIRAAGRSRSNCLLARRLVERGVRFVQLYHRGWDTHGASFGEDIVEKLPHLCRQTDRPIYALLTDLKQRGLLDDTLVVWGGEFGRTPMNEARNGSTFLGRDHHPRALHDVGGRRRHQARRHHRRDRRSRLQRRRGSGRRPRSPRHDAAPARHRSREADLQVPGPRFPADGRPRQGRSGAAGVMLAPDQLTLVLRHLTPARLIDGCAALVVPFDEDGRADLDALGALVQQTYAAGLTPAINTVAGYVELLTVEERADVLAVTAGVALGRRFLAGAGPDEGPGPLALRYARALARVRRQGGTPMLWPCGELTSLDEDAVADVHREATSEQPGDAGRRDRAGPVRRRPRLLARPVSTAHRRADARRRLPRLAQPRVRVVSPRGAGHAAAGVPPVFGPRAGDRHGRVRQRLPARRRRRAARRVPHARSALDSRRRERHRGERRAAVSCAA